MPTVIVSVPAPAVIPPVGPVQRNVGLAPPPAGTLAWSISVVPPLAALQATSAIVIAGFWFTVSATLLVALLQAGSELLVDVRRAVLVPKAVHLIFGVVVVPPLNTLQFAVFGFATVLRISHDAVPLVTDPDMLNSWNAKPSVSQAACGDPALAVALGFIFSATSAVAGGQAGTALLVEVSRAVATPKLVHRTVGVVVFPPLKMEQFAVFGFATVLRICHDGDPPVAVPDRTKSCDVNPVDSQAAAAGDADAVGLAFTVTVLTSLSQFSVTLPPGVVPDTNNLST